MMGAAKIDQADGVIFNMTPSPGATSAIDNARVDMNSIAKQLGATIDEAGFQSIFNQSAMVGDATTTAVGLASRWPRERRPTVSQTGRAIFGADRANKRRHAHGDRRWAVAGRLGPLGSIGPSQSESLPALCPCVGDFSRTHSCNAAARANNWSALGRMEEKHIK